MKSAVPSGAANFFEKNLKNLKKSIDKVLLK